MPELPDVETVARRLRFHMRGRRIRRVRLLTPSTVRFPDPRLSVQLLRGRRFQDVTRRGKYLLIALDDDLTLVVHLRMTGDFEITRPTDPLGRHVRVIFDLNRRQLRFTDLRRFGHMDLLKRGELSRFPGLMRMGVEPLGPEFTLRQFRQLIQGRRGTLKSILLRQDLIAGIGNIYADQILWQARLHPARSAASLSPISLTRLHRTIRHVLRRGVEGLSRHGRPIGRFLEAREGDGACPRCGRMLKISTVAGRTTYSCPFCQH